MTVEVKMYDYEHPDYKRRFAKYEKDMEQFRVDFMNKMDTGEEEEEDTQDEILKRILNEHKEEEKPKEEIRVLKVPDEPEPVSTFKEMHLKDDLVLCYSNTPDPEVLKLYVDNSRIAQEYFIIKKDDKVIEKLNEILK